VLINSGWRDAFVDQAIEQYTRLRERGVNVRLVVGPWDHADVSCPTQKGAFAWLEEHLAQRSVNRAAKTRFRFVFRAPTRSVRVHGGRFPTGLLPLRRGHFTCNAVAARLLRGHPKTPHRATLPLTQLSQPQAGLALSRMVL
jgi:hypothetical protein